MKKKRSIGELIREHPARTATSVILASFLALELDGLLSNIVYIPPNNSCTSPFAVSTEYVNKDASTLFNTDTGIDTTGVLAKGQLAAGAYGIEVAYENPDKQGSGWHISRMVKAGHAGHYAVKTAIGNGPVEFGIRVVAPEGSLACTSIPDVSFEHLGTSEYAQSNARLPWVNVVNGPVDVIAKLLA